MISVIENIMLPMDFCNSYPMGEREKRALHLLDLVGLADHAYKLPPLFQADNNSGWRSRALSRTTRQLSLRMSRRVISIQKLPSRYSRSSMSW